MSDDAIVETIFRPQIERTAFAVAKPSGIEIVTEWSNGDETFVPVRPTNNLLKHRALLFPSQPIDFYSIETLLSDIGAHIRKYVALSDEQVQLSAVYVLLSWVYDAFNELPYLRFRGDYGTGKTRALLVVGSLCYKPFFASGASTVSPIFHTLDTFRGTLIFDEADFRFSDEKAELVKILNNGNVKGFPVLRTQVSDKKTFDPHAFVVFGPKIVGMRKPFEDKALESRFLTIEMEPGQCKDVPINLPDCQKSEALDLRNKLLMYRLCHRRDVVLDPTMVDPLLEPRLNQILLPLLSVAPTRRVRDIIRQTARSAQAGLIADRSVSMDGQVLAALIIVVSAPGASNVSVADIKASFESSFGGDYDRSISNRWIGSVLRRLGIVLYKSNGVIVVAPGQERRIDALCTRFGVPRPGTDATSSA